MKTTEKPTLQTFHIEGVRHIAPEYAYEEIINGNTVIIDVREKDEIDLEYIPMDNVLYHPLSKILDRLEYISKDQSIIVACPLGVRSTKVANLLNQQGYPDVANLDGGLMMWKQKGLPFIINNLSPQRGCSCGCKPTKSNDSCC